MLGESWKERYFSLDGAYLSYSKDGGKTFIDRIPLNPTATVRVIRASEPARKDRFEGGEKVAMGMNMLADMSSPYGSAIGKNNCIELVLSEAQSAGLGGLLGSMMGGGGGGGSSVRTYYAHASSAAVAEEWRQAIQHNIEVLGYQPPQPPPRPTMPTQNQKNPGELDWSKMGPVGSLMGALTPSPEAQKQIDQRNNAMVSGLFGGALDGVMNRATEMKDRQKEAYDPSTSLGWYRFATLCKVPDEEFFLGLSMFYDELERNGIC
jgi:hypothetical protein